MVFQRLLERLKLEEVERPKTLEERTKLVSQRLQLCRERQDEPILESEMKAKKTPMFQGSPWPGGFHLGRPTKRVTTGGARQMISALFQTQDLISLRRHTSEK